VQRFFERERPAHVFLPLPRSAAFSNELYPADFIRENLIIQANVIDASYRAGVDRLLFLGSSCIYPKLCPQPVKEEYLLTGPLEPANRPYALAKSPASRCVGPTVGNSIPDTWRPCLPIYMVRATTSIPRTRTSCRR
jgi:nucleoside-diphosphate-sugar epimerase